METIEEKNNKSPYCVHCDEEYKDKVKPDFYCEKCDMYTVMYD